MVPRIVVDRTHMARRASGIERITATLFSAEALAPLQVRCIDAAPARLAIANAQMMRAPLAALRDPQSVWVFPGYPPSPAFALLRERCIHYVHDLFLLTRPSEFNMAGRLYMTPLFKMSVTRLRYFFCNSQQTRIQLEAFAPADADIRLYRPPAVNVFDLKPKVFGSPDETTDRPLVLGAIGTIEPRKNLPAAARITKALAVQLGRPVELHVVGRPGWGGDTELLEREQHVRLHGFLPDAAARSAIVHFDALINTSHDEGLGLPLIEIQHAGIPVIAPDKPIFHEVLGTSGTFIDPADPAGAAHRIAGLLSDNHWRRRAAHMAATNLTRWNDAAERDRHDAISFLSNRLHHVTRKAAA